MAAKKFAAMHKGLLSGADPFPLTFKLGEFTQESFLANLPVIREWASVWTNWTGPGRIQYVSHQWSQVGTQKLPAKLEVGTAEELASLAGALSEWKISLQRITQLADAAEVPIDRFVRLYALVQAYSAEDWSRLVTVTQYLAHSDVSGLYLRQLPIPGVDTKWIGTHLVDVTKILRVVKARDAEDFYELTGVRKQPHRVRIRLLCPLLRAQMAGLGDFEVPLHELMDWTIRPARLIITENLETGVALPDMPSTFAIMGLGNAVTELGKVDWLQSVPGAYFGDLDTYGLAIFSRVSCLLPRLTPILMDSATLLAHQDLWVTEDRQHQKPDNLPEAQAEVFDLMLGPGRAQRARLEQERLPWPTVVAALQASCALD